MNSTISNIRLYEQTKETENLQADVQFGISGSHMRITVISMTTKPLQVYSPGSPATVMLSNELEL
jgi:hypothetical protein